MSRPEAFVTPEAVVLETDLAGLGSRFVASLLDGLIEGAVILAAALAAAASTNDLFTVFLVVAISYVLMSVGYPLAMEALTSGKTVGKMAMRIRVVGEDGSPVATPAVLVRNLLRLIDMLPGNYTVGAIAILVTRKGQRLGDLAAGTVVIHEAPPPVPAVLELGPRPGREQAARSVDPAGISEEEYALVRSFLLRRSTLEPQPRATLARDLAARLRPMVGAHTDASDPEAFLEALASAYRQRWGSV